MDPTQFQRRIARVEFKVLLLDLSSPGLQRELRLKGADLTADDLRTCQTLADLVADAGFEAVLGPSAAVPGEETFAVFSRSITSGKIVTDRGIAPGQET